jgi:hypothetical protein
LFLIILLEGLEMGTNQPGNGFEKTKNAKGIWNWPSGQK